MKVDVIWLGAPPERVVPLRDLVLVKWFPEDDEE
jgi:hypothetical protein